MENIIPRVAAIHDLSGFGRASLMVVIPILSNMGIQVCPLPTAVLSTNSKFPDFHFVDLTDEMPEILKHWQQLKVSFEAIYSGFLGSPRQVDIVAGCIRDFHQKGQQVIIDPVLGDDGEVYVPLRNGMVPEMRRLIEHADIITPNLTEAALLLDTEHPHNPDSTMIKDWCRALADKGPETVIITSIPEPDPLRQTSVIAYNARDKRFWKVSCDYLPASYPGTGDSFTSVIVGSLLQKDSLPIALDRAVQFISGGVRATFGHPYDNREGMLLEKVLPNLKNSTHLYSYQLLE